MTKVKNSIPNCVTLLNLLAGTVAIIFAFEPNARITGIFGWDFLGWQWASIVIGAAALFDFMDGLVARALHAKSEIGKELDSLCDLVSFGVAPSLMLLNVLLEAGGGWWSYISLFIPLMGAMRLAKFNVDTTQTTSFRGLPIPSNAIFWIGFVGALYQWNLSPRMSVVAVIIVAISLLMVSNLRMFSLKLSNLSFRSNLLPYTLLIGSIICVAFLGVAGLAAAILLYLLLSVVKVTVKVSYK